MRFSIDDIADRLRQPLPDYQAHKQMIPIGRKMKPDEQTSKNAVPAASLLLLRTGINAHWEICLTKRATHLKKHSGQISFPGGKQEVNETLSQTALREAKEEITLPASQVELLGKLSPLYIPPTNFLLHPFVGFLKTNISLAANEAEVERIFWVSNRNLRENIGEQVVSVDGKTVKVPGFAVSDEFIWGATAMILAEWQMIVNHEI